MMDGVPATSVSVGATGSGAFDKYGNFYFAASSGANKIWKVNTLGIITTVAGDGTSGYGGDNGAATLAKLRNPSGLALDSIGNVYIADASNHRLRKVNVATGIITTVAGDGTAAFFGDGLPATDAKFNFPSDVCIDKFGNVYIADLYNNRVRKINTAGIMSTFVGTGLPISSGDGGPATAANTAPHGLCADDTGNIYIAEEGTGMCRIRKVNTAGIISTVAGSGGSTYSGDGIPATNANIIPSDAFFSNGELYIVDQYNNRIRKVDAMGIIHTVVGDGSPTFGGDGGPATAAQISHPAGVALDTCGNIFVGDNSNRRIRKVIIDTPCYSYVTLGIGKSQGMGSMRFYPNPVFDMLVLEGEENIAEATITNMVGEMVQRMVGSSRSRKMEIDVHWLPPGMYMVRVTDSGGNATVHKISKQ
jgi:hypothetical protein